MLDAFLGPYLLDWAHLFIRWLHLTAGIAWIGSSFYFIALDLHLIPPRDEQAKADDVAGEAWEIHGGGFYRVQKYRVAPPALPEILHWFKWEAYTTWLSGFALLVVLYFFNADTYLIDRSVLDLRAEVAVLLALGVMGLGWGLYDRACRALEDRDGVLAVLVAAAVVALSFGLSHVFSARAVYLLVGATLGSIMAANVYYVIIPGQHDLVKAKRENRPPDPIHGIRGKQRSIHNNYFTLPVLFAMMSNHFPVTYGHPNGWLILVAIMALAAWFRHFFNLRHQGRVVWAIPASTVAGFAVLIALIAPRGDGSLTVTATLSEAQAVVQARCVECHSIRPTNVSFVSGAPKGVVLDTPEDLQREADRVYQQVVVAKVMPLGNMTGMTQAERDVVAAWYRSRNARP